MIWQIPRIWEGGECWIIGGGPSLARQFNVPEDVIEKVRNKIEPLNAYSPYFSPIHDKHVIGVNAAFMLGKWVDIMFFGDSRFYTHNRKALQEFSNLKVTCHYSLINKMQHERLKYVAKDGGKKEGISFRPGYVSWNKNSGAAAINLAVHLGVQKIYLLGFDMKIDENQKQHWHSHYVADINKPLNPKQLPFSRHLKGFPAIAKDAKRRGIEIINVNPDSAINDFEKRSLKELL